MAQNDVKVAIGLDDSEFQAGMRRAESVAADSSRAIDGHMAAIAASVSAAMVAGAGVAMASFVKSAIDSADALNDLSARTGLAASQLAGWNVAATMSGTSIEAVATAQKKLSTSLVQNSELFQKLGIDTKNPTEAMIQLADVFAGIDDQAQRAALAQEIFGKAGAEMLPMLLDGTAALRDQIAAGQQLNPVTDEMAARAGAFNDKLDMMRMASQSVATQVAGNMLPIFDQLAGQFIQTANDSGALKQAADVLTNALRLLVSGAVVGIGIFSDLGSVIGGTAAAAMSALSGNFAQAGSILSQVEADHQARAARLKASLAGIWADAPADAPNAAAPRARDTRGAQLVGALVRPAAGNGRAAADTSARDAARAAEEARKMQVEQISAAASAAADAVSVEMELSKRKTALGQQSQEKELLTAQELANKKYQIELDAAKKLAELEKQKPLEYAKALDKIAQMQRAHDLDMIKAQTALEVERKRVRDAADAEQKKQMEEMFAPLTKAFDKSVTGIITGQMSLTSGLRNMAQSIALEYANLGVKLVADWLKTELEKTLISQTQGSIRAAADAGKSASGGGGGGGLGGLVSGAVDWARGLFSAAGGFDVPSGINPVTQLHSNEMVLPADIAQPLREAMRTTNNTVTVNMMMAGGQAGQPVDQIRRAGGQVAQQLAAVMGASGRFA